MLINQKNINLALKEIFDTDKNTNDFYLSNLNFLQIEMLKDAYRKKAKMFHPDRASILGISELSLNEKFKKINDSYKLLLNVIKYNKISITSKNQDSYNQNHQQKKEHKNTSFGNFYYEGVIPKRKLRFAEFLYYSKKINWDTLIKSIVWQFQNRPKFGDISIELNFMNKNDILEILKNMNYKMRFGEIALKLGKISNIQMNIVLGKQKSYKNQIGKYFVEKGFFSNVMLKKYLLDNQNFNINI